MLRLPFNPVQRGGFIGFCTDIAAQAGQLFVVKALGFEERALQDVMIAFVENGTACTSVAFLPACFTVQKDGPCRHLCGLVSGLPAREKQRDE